MLTHFIRKIVRSDFSSRVTQATHLRASENREVNIITSNWYFSKSIVRAAKMWREIIRRKIISNLMKKILIFHTTGTFRFDWSLNDDCAFACRYSDNAPREKKIQSVRVVVYVVIMISGTELITYANFALAHWPVAQHSESSHLCGCLCVNVTAKIWSTRLHMVFFLVAFSSCFLFTLFAIESLIGIYKLWQNRIA